MRIDGIFSALRISASGLRAQRIRQNIISSNIANIETTRTAEGGPYRRQYAVFEAESTKKYSDVEDFKSRLSGMVTNYSHMRIPNSIYTREYNFLGNGVKVAEIREDSKPPKMVYDPSHPDADEKGYVAMPNINIVKEMADMISATRAYEANVTAFNATKNMLKQALQL